MTERKKMQQGLLYDANYTGEAQKQKPKVLYGSIGRLDVVLSVLIVPLHQN